MDDAQEQPETQPSATAVESAATPEPSLLGERVREVREHLGRAGAALAALAQLLPAGTQPVDGQTNDQTSDRGEL